MIINKRKLRHIDGETLLGRDDFKMIFRYKRFKQTKNKIKNKNKNKKQLYFCHLSLEFNLTQL